MPDDQTTAAEAVPRCPKCKSTTFRGFVQELREGGADIVNGSPRGGWMNSAEPMRQAAFGECRCGHKWRFRDKWALS